MLQPEETEELSPSSTGVDIETQTNSLMMPMYRIERFTEDSTAISYLTGFSCFSHLILLYNFLLPAAENLVYKPAGISPLNQLFMTLIKLRQNKDDTCLAIDFGLSRHVVSRIINQWINFLYLELSEVNWWLPPSTVQEYFPLNFKKMFPTTRVILDATEIPIEKPLNVNSQRITFSSYKNTNTVKTLVGIAPRGQVTYVSEAYGGSASDRQIIERSELLNNQSMLKSGDSIMSDRGIMVQDLFASRDVCVNTPTTMKGRNQLPASIVVKDRRIASKRIHVERAIGYAKTYKILKSTLCQEKVPLANRIIQLCMYLTNFRTCIVNKFS